MSVLNVGSAVHKSINRGRTSEFVSIQAYELRTLVASYLGLTAATDGPDYSPRTIISTTLTKICILLC
jgi:hypothetical protein